MNRLYVCVCVYAQIIPSGFMAKSSADERTKKQKTSAAKCKSDNILFPLGPVSSASRRLSVPLWAAASPHIHQHTHRQTTAMKLHHSVEPTSHLRLSLCPTSAQTVRGLMATHANARTHKGAPSDVTDCVVAPEGPPETVGTRRSCCITAWMLQEAESLSCAGAGCRGRGWRCHGALCVRDT